MTSWVMLHHGDEVSLAAVVDIKLDALITYVCVCVCKFVCLLV